jgi:hypothetical protein
MNKQIFIRLLLFFMFNNWSIAQQDWQNILLNGERGNALLNVEIDHDTIYTAWFRWNQDTVWGITLSKFDSLGNMIDSIDFMSADIVHNTFQYFTGMSIYAGKLYFWGTCEQKMTYLIITDLSFTNAKVLYYTDPDVVVLSYFNTSMLINTNGLYLLSRNQVNDEYDTGDAVITHTDHEGNLVWRKTYGLPGLEELPMCIIQKSENEIVIAGSRASPFNAPVPFTQRWNRDWAFGIDTLGNTLWDWESPVGELRGGIRSISKINNKYYYASYAAFFTGVLTFNTLPDITCTDLQFNQIWRSKMQVSSPDHSAYFHSAAVTPDSTAMVAVTALARYGQPFTHFKVRLSDGVIMYQREDSICTPNSIVTNEGSLYDVAMLSSGSTISCGLVAVFTDTQRNYGILMKTNAWGADLLDDCSTVSSDEPYYTIEKAFVYPNPASDHFTVQAPNYTGAFDIRLYNSVGGLMHAQHFGPGEQPQLQVAHLAAGLYFVQVVSEQGVLLAVGKVVVEH